jgi:hypothetical protein
MPVADLPPYQFAAYPLTQAVRNRITGTSWQKGCPVGLDDLRYVRVSYVGFDGEAHSGELMVNASAVKAMRGALRTLYRARFPIRRMRLVDDYRGDDYASIQADNTSAFNCRRATGLSRWSDHAYGRAIDINPIENPYVSADGSTAHVQSIPYLNRKRHRRGMAFQGGVLVRAFAEQGWGWGGSWSGPVDYQHFSSTGR